MESGWIRWLKILDHRVVRRVVELKKALDSSSRTPSDAPSVATGDADKPITVLSSAASVDENDDNSIPNAMNPSVAASPAGGVIDEPISEHDRLILREPRPVARSSAKRGATSVTSSSEADSKEPTPAEVRTMLAERGFKASSAAVCGFGRCSRLV
ncbi:hypothetical protein K474DRAFT_721831 [Panus rudis PR-1116 ss-1]|nr:hypothetical protein K474DRAFT_721831 [Panus rudis PR-1116 ss-1]